MAKIKTTKSDILWNYISTILSMGSSFLLLPFLLAFLSSSELGLWYTFVAIGNLTLLFEFGFTPTFARNIVYCLSGARAISKRGYDSSLIGDSVDYKLLGKIIKTSRLVYALISVVVLILTATVGSLYIGSIASSIDPVSCWVAWSIFCFDVFFNLFFFHYTTCLRGFGDISAESRAKSYGRIAQLVTSGLLLFLGFGIVGAAIGYLMNDIVLRFFCGRFLKLHSDAMSKASDACADVTFKEVASTFSSVAYLAWRDGVVQFCCYVSTQLSSLLCSYFLGVEANSQYSLIIQVGGAIYGFASAYVRSFIPMFQSAYAGGENQTARSIIEKSLSLYWVLIVACTVGVWFVGFPVLSIVKKGFSPDCLLYLALVAYLAVWNHHSLCCNYIISTNEIPYLPAYILSALFGFLLSFALVSQTSVGVWGLVLGNGIAQLAYNNWKWPMYLARKFSTRYYLMIKNGTAQWVELLCKKFAH